MRLRMNDEATTKNVIFSLSHSSIGDKTKGIKLPSKQMQKLQQQKWKWVWFLCNLMDAACNRIARYTVNRQPSLKSHLHFGFLVRFFFSLSFSLYFSLSSFSSFPLVSFLAHQHKYGTAIHFSPGIWFCPLCSRYSLSSCVPQLFKLKWNEWLLCVKWMENTQTKGKIIFQWIQFSSRCIRKCI